MLYPQGYQLKGVSRSSRSSPPGVTTVPMGLLSIEGSDSICDTVLRIDYGDDGAIHTLGHSNLNRSAMDHPNS